MKADLQADGKELEQLVAEDFTLGEELMDDRSVLGKGGRELLPGVALLVEPAKVETPAWGLNEPRSNRPHLAMNKYSLKSPFWSGR